MRERPIKPQDILTPEKAWLLGFLAGDGSVVHELGDHRVIGCFGKDHKLAEHGASLVRSIYGMPCDVSLSAENDWRTRCHSKGVVEDLLSLGTWGLLTWSVPKVVETGSDQIKAAWLSGFVDADGYVGYKPAPKGYRWISIDSINSAGLRQAGTLLKSLGIGWKWYSYRNKEAGWRETFSIKVMHHADFERFGVLVGFKSFEKKATLKAALAAPRVRPIRYGLVGSQLEEVIALRVRGYTHQEIATVFGCSDTEIRRTCKRIKVQAGPLMVGSVPFTRARNGKLVAPGGKTP